MLSGCRESRSVALKRFKLCLGTPNVYADFSGGDIIYFGSHWDQAYLVFQLEEYHNSALLSGIREIPRIALWNGIWRKFSSPDYLGGRNGHSLRYKVRDSFPNLKELFLINSGPDSDLGSEFAKTPGHIVFEDKPDPYIGNPPTTWD
jgi:hypothetical protein